MAEGEIVLKLSGSCRGNLDVANTRFQSIARERASHFVYRINWFYGKSRVDGRRAMGEIIRLV